MVYSNWTMPPGITQIQECDAIIVDIDGTLIVNDQVLPGAAEFLSRLRRKKIDVYYVTNSTVRSSEQILLDLNTAQFHAEPAQLITATVSTIQYLKQQDIASIYLIGTTLQEKEFEQHGIAVRDDASAVVVSFSEHLDYAQLRHATKLIMNGAAFVVTNADTTMVHNGETVPDTGATAAFLRAATGVEPILTGKPGTIVMEMLLSHIGVPANRIGIIGDQMSIDMHIAEMYGLVSVLVLSGKQKREDMLQYSYQPDYVVESVENLIPLFS